MDVLMVGFIGGYIYAGWRTGFLRRLAGLGFLALSFVLGAYLRSPIGALLSGFFTSVPQPYLEMVGYTIAVAALTIVATFVSGPVLSKVAVSGVSKELNAALGAVLGGAEAILILSIVIVILDTYFGPKGQFGGDPGLGIFKQLAVAIGDSTTGQILRETTVPFVLAILGPLLPRDVTSLIPAGLPFPSGVPIPGLPTAKPTTH
jgi:uncharacterized membrane protein required for colicin V production